MTSDEDEVSQKEAPLDLEEEKQSDEKGNLGYGSILPMRKVHEKRPSKSEEKDDSKKQCVLGKFLSKKEGEESSLKLHSFGQDKCRKALAMMCIKDNRPFSIVEDEGFKEFAWEMNPKFKILSRSTVTRDCLNIYKQEAKKLKRLLTGQLVSLTTDTWTSIQKINYVCLTTHWIDDGWKL